MTKRRKDPGAQRLGAKGGRARTPKQNAARRQNAQHAGRPRRVCIHCGEPVVGGHTDRQLDQSCGQNGWRWQQRDAPLTFADVQPEINRLALLLQTLADRMPTTGRPADEPGPTPDDDNADTIAPLPT